MMCHAQWHRGYPKATFRQIKVVNRNEFMSFVLGNVNREKTTHCFRIQGNTIGYNQVIKPLIFKSFKIKF